LEAGWIAQYQVSTLGGIGLAHWRSKSSSA
jgi:hypothetical protein